LFLACHLFKREKFRYRASYFNEASWKPPVAGR